MLYKYLSTKSKSYTSILEDLEVYFASCSRLNDPFEGTPYYSLPSKTEIKQHLAKRGVKRGKLKQHLEQAIEHFKSAQETLNSNESWRGETGILCLTPDSENLLMWSHYGDEHKGVCIGFEVNHPFDSVFGTGYQVEYSDTYPEIPTIQIEELMLEEMNGGKELSKFDDVSTKQFYTKAKCWEYEKEVRFIRTPFPHGIGIMPFPSMKLKEIILGCKMNENERNKTINYAKKNFPHAKVFQSVMSPIHYKLHFDEIIELEKC